MVQDQFGMMGLLTFIRAAETDPGLVALALGRCAVHIIIYYEIHFTFHGPLFSDLTTLGLNLNSPE